MNLEAEALDTRWAINRNKALASAGEAIIEAQKRLDQLVEIHRDASIGKIPDIGSLVDICHALGEAKNEILVSLIEANSVPEKKDRTGLGWSAK